MQDHDRHIQLFRPTFRNMQDRIPGVADEQLQAKLSVILAKLASGVHPTTAEILAIKSLFRGEPFHLNCLYPRHKVTTTQHKTLKHQH